MKLIEKVKKAEVALFQRHGKFALFGLFEREDTPAKWDVVVAASWLTTNMAGIAQIAEALTLELATEDWQAIARIYPLKSTDEFVRSIAVLYPVEHGLQEIPRSLINGVSINHALIITADFSAIEDAEFQVLQVA